LIKVVVVFPIWVGVRDGDGIVDNEAKQVNLENGRNYDVFIFLFIINSGLTIVLEIAII